MKKTRLGDCATVLTSAAALVAVFFLINGVSAAANQSSPAAANLYQDIMSHKAGMNWQASPDDNYPDDACSVMDACSSDGSKPQVSVLPIATIDGHRVARAVYLVKVKDPKQSPAVVFEHQSASQTYFFRVSPDGSILHIAYLERGGNWMAIAKQLGQPIYNKDAVDWQAALAKSGPSGAKPAQ
jgi:hypothetical protein